MFCNKCGAPLAEGVRFCTHCGAPVPQELIAARAAVAPDIPSRSPGQGMPSRTPSRIRVPVSRAPASAVRRARRPSSRRALRTILVILLVLLAFGAAGYLAYPSLGSLLFGKVSESHREKAAAQREAFSSGMVTTESLAAIQTELTTAIRLDPRNTQAREDLAAFAASTGDLATAGKQVEVILMQDPANKYALLMKDLLAPDGAP